MQTDNEKFVAELNAVRVTYRDIRRLVKACMKDYVKGGDNADLLICKSVIVFEKQREKGKAAYFRLSALGKLMRQDNLKGWTFIGNENETYVSGLVFEAAAQEPLVLIDNDAVFEPESFKKRILKLARPEGRA